MDSVMKALRPTLDEYMAEAKREATSAILLHGAIILIGVAVIFDMRMRKMEKRV